MNVNEAKAICGFKFNPTSNAWTNDIIVTRYYSQPPDMSIIEQSRRVGAHPRISVESQTYTISLTSEEDPNPILPVEESESGDAAGSSQEEIQSPSPVEDSGHSYDRALFIKVAAGIAGAVGLAFIAAIVVVIAVRRRRLRKAQASFNFEGVNSN